MAITITTREKDPINIGGVDRAAVLTVALDTSYPAGGETITPSDYGFGDFDVVLAEPTDGYTFEYDHTNLKLKAYQDAPAMRIEEQHTSVSNVVTLDYPAAWIMSAAKTSTALIWNKTAIGTAVLGTNHFCLRTAIVDGERTQLFLDASATIYVSYITQAWTEIYNCLVQNESVVATTGDTNLANPIMGFGYCTNSTGDTIYTPVTISDTTATGEVGIDFAAGTATGALNFSQTIATSGTVYVTYLKTAAANSFVADRYTSDEDTTTGTVAGTLTKPVAVWCNSGYGCTSASTINRMATRDATLVTSQFKVLWGQMGSTSARLQPVAGFGATTGMMHGLAYVSAYPWEIPTVPLEVPDGTDLSNVTGLKVRVFGR